MDNFDKSIYNELLQPLHNQLDEYQHRFAQVAKYETKILKPSYHKNGIYYGSTKSDGSSDYLGREPNPTISNIREARLLSPTIDLLEFNISVLEEALARLQPFDPFSVTACLPKTYRMPELTENARLARIKEWQAQQLEIKKMYPVKYPEQITVKHHGKLRFRSKSELLIAKSFEDYGIPYEYEVPIEIDNVVLYPDFRILSPADLMTEYILEHFGRLDLPSYQKVVGYKIHSYMKEGYFPNVNFFMTFDGANGEVDLGPLYEIIAKITFPLAGIIR